MTNSKKKYIAPEVEISVFETDDIMALSSLGNTMTGGIVIYKAGSSTYDNAGNKTYTEIFF